MHRKSKYHLLDNLELVVRIGFAVVLVLIGVIIGIGISGFI